MADSDRTLLLTSLGLSSVVASCVLGQVVSRWVTPATVVEGGDRKIWFWKNGILALFHSLVCGLCAVVCLYKRPLILDGEFDELPLLLHSLCAIRAGFIIYDLLRVLLNPRTRFSEDVVFHHVVLLSCLPFVATSPQLLAFVVVGLMGELPFVAMDGRKLLLAAGMTNHSQIGRLSKFIATGSSVLLIVPLACMMHMYHASCQQPFWTQATLGVSLYLGVQSVTRPSLGCYTDKQ